MRSALQNRGYAALVGALLALPALGQNAQTNIAITAATATSTGGSDNTLVGVGAGNANMSGSSNLILGRGAGIQNGGGQQNSFVGASSGKQNTGGSYNSFFGFESGTTPSSVVVLATPT